MMFWPIFRLASWEGETHYRHTLSMAYEPMGASTSTVTSFVKRFVSADISNIRLRGNYRGSAPGHTPTRPDGPPRYRTRTDRGFGVGGAPWTSAGGGQGCTCLPLDLYLDFFRTHIRELKIYVNFTFLRTPLWSAAIDINRTPVSKTRPLSSFS